MRRYVATSITSVIAATLVLAPLVIGIDLVDVSARLLGGIARSKLNTSIIAVVLILIALGIDAFAQKLRTKREAEIQAQRLILFKATMRTVQEIVNNALNQMQLFRLDGEGLLPEESLRLFDDLIERTAAELKSLADLDSPPDRDSPTGHILNYERKSPAKISSESGAKPRPRL